MRVYVRDHTGRDGIWFLTMLVPRVSFQAALRSIGLPYHRSDCATRVDGRPWDYRFGERTPVHHQQWPLHEATVIGELTAPLRRTGLPEPRQPPMVHAAPVVHARLGSLRPA